MNLSVLGKENYVLYKTKTSFVNLPFFFCFVTFGSFVLLVISPNMSLHYYRKVSIL